MELITAYLRFTTSRAVSQPDAGTTADALIAALLVSLILVVGSSWWIFRRRAR